MFQPQRFFLPAAVAMWCAALRRTGYVAAFSSVKSTRRFPSTRPVISMSTTATSAAADIIPRIKAADALEPSDGPVFVKGWVRTVRKQKTLAFVEVNDGSNNAGIQCVLSFDAIDEETQAGKKITSTLTELMTKVSFIHIL
jgi:hypothetical protein